MRKRVFSFEWEHREKDDIVDKKLFYELKDTLDKMLEDSENREKTELSWSLLGDAHVDNNTGDTTNRHGRKAFVAKFNGGDAVMVVEEDLNVVNMAVKKYFFKHNGVFYEYREGKSHLHISASTPEMFIMNCREEIKLYLETEADRCKSFRKLSTDKFEAIKRFLG